MKSKGKPAAPAKVRIRPIVALTLSTDAIAVLDKLAERAGFRRTRFVELLIIEVARKNDMKECRSCGAFIDHSRFCTMPNVRKSSVHGKAAPR